ncbi:hypothetical protein FBQ81_02710 [Chloroflexi bacterium CFX6]|nr:hypothetical protein [Chloroflexi bacterium CFX6]
MSQNSSNSKSGIQSLDEYNEILELYHDAHDRIQSGGTGMGYSGIHYMVMNKLRRYGIFVNGREEAVQALKKLLKEYENAHGGQTQTDEEYLETFDDDEL